MYQIDSIQKGCHFQWIVHGTAKYAEDGLFIYRGTLHLIH